MPRDGLAGAANGAEESNKWTIRLSSKLSQPNDGGGMRKQRRRRSMGRELVKGAVAGAIATAVMDLATRYFKEHEDPGARRREQRARRGRSPSSAAAEKAAAGAGVALAPAERRAAGRVLHYALGMGAGAVYAAVRPRFAGFDLGRGAGFGTGFWLLVDETVAPMLGLTAGPGAFPWQTHVRGLAGHLIFGAVTDSTLDALDRVM